MSRGGRLKICASIGRLDYLICCSQMPALALFDWIVVKVPMAALWRPRIGRCEAIVFSAAVSDKQAEHHERYSEDWNQLGFCHQSPITLAQRWIKIRCSKFDCTAAQN